MQMQFSLYVGWLLWRTTGLNGRGLNPCQDHSLLLPIPHPDS
jgi:hypothetical protein